MRLHQLTLDSGQSVPVRTLCRLLAVPRSTAYYQPRPRATRTPRFDTTLATRIHGLIQAHPTFGVRRVWAWLHFRDGLSVNRKKIHRLMRLHRWTCRQRPAGRRPRVPGSRSIAARPDERWATDIALVDCGADGWCSFIPVLDCCTREVLGWELDHSARAKTAERALENALLARFGALRGAPKGLRLRHDNGLVFGSRLYRATVADYGLTQEWITPYTPEQNGLCERFIRSFKEECAWQHRFESLAHARLVITAYLHHYNHLRPHQALDYQSPAPYHHHLCTNAA